MGRAAKLDPPVRFEINLPTSVHDRLRQELYSEVENRVPYGALSNLMTQLTTQWLRDRGVII